MRSALFLAVFAVMTGRGGCDPVSPYDPCDGKPCGDPCRLCAPDDADCVETMVVKACDAKGECVADGTFACDPLPPPPYDPCEGKVCGESCGICPPESPCPTFAATACDPFGECATVGTFKCEEPPPPPPADPCADKKCGDPCNTCDPATGVCPAIAVMAWCDAGGRCGYEVPVCEPPPPPVDPCAGKLCGDACSTCDPATGTMCLMVMTYCDAAGACGFTYPVCTTATR